MSSSQTFHGSVVLLRTAQRARTQANISETIRKDWAEAADQVKVIFGKVDITPVRGSTGTIPSRFITGWLRP
jgi:trehalose-6-phosphate synthase